MRIFSKLLPASKMKLVISSIGVLALVVFSVAVVYAATKSEVTIVKDGDSQTYQTHANTVEELLEEIDITVGEYDALSHNRNAAIENGMEIEWKTANKVIISIDGDKQQYYTVTDTVGDFLKENQLSFSSRDDISHDKDTKITDGLEIAVNQAFEVTIQDGLNEEQVWTTGGTIQDLLQTNNIILNDHDKVVPELSESVTENTVVDITRVEVTTVEVEETIEFSTETKQDPNLEKGKKRVISEGKNGKLVKTYEVTLENGEEVRRELIEENVAAASEQRVVAMGTKEPIRNLTTLSSGSEPSSGKELYVSSTAYTANCNGCSGFTATGINLNANPHMKVISVDPSVIPLGTKVWVEGYGVAIAGDTGSAIKGNKIDVHVPTKADAYKWGRKRVKIKILD